MAPTKTRVRLTVKQKIELLGRHAMGNIKQSDPGKWAMEKFKLRDCLSQQTISCILKQSDEFYSKINTICNSKSLKAARYPQLDVEITNYVAEMNANNLPVNRASILHFIATQAESKYKIPKNELKFSDR